MGHEAMSREDRPGRVRRGAGAGRRGAERRRPLRTAGREDRPGERGAEEAPGTEAPRDEGR